MSSSPIVTDVVVTTTNESSGADQEIALSLNGETPVLVVVIVYRTTVDDDESGSGTSDQPANNAMASYGCTDGTNEWVLSMSSQDNVAVSDCYQWFRNESVALVTDPNNGSIEARASIDSVGPDLVVLQWDTSPASDWKMVVFAVGGGEADAEVGTAFSSATQDATASVSHSLGVAPRGMIFGCNTVAVNNSAASNMGRFGLGYASYDGSTIRQCSQALRWIDADSGARIAGRVSDEYAVTVARHQALPIGEPVRAHIEVTAVSSSAVTVTTRSQAERYEFGYAFLAGVECFAGLWTFPSDTGVKQFATPSGVVDVRPRGVLLTNTRIQTAEINASQTNVRAGTFGWGAVGSDGTAGTGCITQERNTVPLNTRTHFDDRPYHNHPHTGTNPGNHGDWDNFAIDGWGIDVVDGAANDVQFPQLLIGLVQVAPTGLAEAPVFGSPDLALRLEPTGLDAGLAFGLPSLALRLTLTGFGVPLGYGAPSLALRIDLTGLPVAVVLGSPSFTIGLAPTGLDAGLAFGAPSLALQIALTGLGVDFGLGAPTLLMTQEIAPTGLGLPVTFGGPTFGLRLEPTGLAVAGAFGNPALALAIGPTGLAVAVTFGLAAVQGPQVATSPGPASNVVQSGLVAGIVSQSGMVQANEVQSGVVAGVVSQSGLVAGQVVQSGLVAGGVA